MRLNKWSVVILLTSLCLVVGIFLASHLLARHPFEGRIVQTKVTIPLSIFPPDEAENNPETADKLFEIPIDVLKKMTKDQAEHVLEQTATIYVKAHRYRIETEHDAQRISIINDLDTGRVITLRWPSRTAAVTGMDPVEPVIDQRPGPTDNEGGKTSDDERFSALATGQVKIINGFRCELYKGINRTGDYTRLWMTKDITDLPVGFMPVFAQLLNIVRTESATDNERTFFTANNGIPVLVQSITPAELEIQQTAEIVRQAVSEESFGIPPDFKQIELQQTN